MSSIVLNVDPVLGHGAYEVMSDALTLARRLDVRVRFVINGIAITVYPEMSAEEMDAVFARHWVKP